MGRNYVEMGWGAAPYEEHSVDCERVPPMTNPKPTDTSRSGDLVANMRDTIREWERDEPRDDWFLHQHDFAEAADRIEALEAENERLREALEEFVASTGVSDDPDVLLVEASVYENAMRVLGLQK